MAIKRGLAGLDARLVHLAVVGLDEAVCLLDAALRAARPGDGRISGDQAGAARLARQFGGREAPAMKWPPAKCGTAELTERGNQ